MNNEITIKTYSDINRIYNTNFDERDLSDFELKIFNNNGEFDKYEYNTDNSDIIYSLINYNDVTKNNNDYLIYTQKLIDLNDPRGYLKMGLYHHKKKDYINAALCYERGGEMGNIHSIVNYGVIYLDKNLCKIDLDKSEKYLINACNKSILGLKLATIYLVELYLLKKDITNGFKYIVIGLKNNNIKCLEILEVFVGNNQENLFLILSSLSFSNEMIKNKIEEIKNNIYIDKCKIDKKFIIKDENNKNYFVLINDRIEIKNISDEEIEILENNNPL